jgi:hypothetical protein
MFALCKLLVKPNVMLAKAGLRSFCPTNRAQEPRLPGWPVATAGLTTSTKPSRRFGHHGTGPSLTTCGRARPQGETPSKGAGWTRSRSCDRISPGLIHLPTNRAAEPRFTCELLHSAGALLIVKETRQRRPSRSEATYRGQAGHAESRSLGFDTLCYSTGVRSPGLAHSGLFLK